MTSVRLYSKTTFDTSVEHNKFIWHLNISRKVLSLGVNKRLKPSNNQPSHEAADRLESLPHHWDRDKMIYYKYDVVAEKSIARTHFCGFYLEPFYF